MLKPEQQQCLLGALGYYILRRKDGSLAIDGLPGPSTRAAIRRFQKESGLDPDGIWGPVTEAAICQTIRDLAEPKTPQPVPETEDVGQLVWDILTAEGLPPEAVAGILGNLDAESAMNPRNMENQYEGEYRDQTYTEAVDSGLYGDFAGDGVGYGLAQWTWPSRKTTLLQFSRDTGRSVGDPKMQAEFLIRELRQSYQDLLSRLMACREVGEAAVDFLLTFEQPLDQGDSIRQDRTERALTFFTRYSGEPVPIWEHPRVKPFFKRSEFICPHHDHWCGGFPVEPAEDLVWACVEVREEANRRKPGTVFNISSAVRCQYHNDELPGSVPDSRHVKGRAVDFFLPGFTSAEILEMAKANPRIVFAYIMESGWVHMDIGN